ncbi:hypothetical protein BBJ28_00013525 [Nothophytophthora sp. Chile5]|nr:hypothetical protein BBJ28_00013525 [Nothophytophthora sp. Chile5]
MQREWRALPLVCGVSHGGVTRLEVSEDARDALLSIHTRNVGVLGVFGPPASGKRLLLRTLLNARDVDFSASSGPASNAVLLWLWLPIDGGPETPDCARIVLSSGSVAEKQGDEGDSNAVSRQVLTLLLLLSSAVLYNADGDVDAPAIERLDWLADVAKLLRVKTMQDEEGLRADDVSVGAATASDFHEHAPKFVWLARSFKLKWLRGVDGEKLTPDAYLADRLAPEGGYGDAATQRNTLRMYLESYFPLRGCVALSRAAEGTATEDAMTERSALRSQFVDAVDALYAAYLSAKGQDLPAKQLMGRDLSSEQLVAVLDTYVAAMNDGKLPTMQKAANTLQQAAVSEAFRTAEETYKAEVDGGGSQETGEGLKGARELQLAHLRGLQTAMAHVQELRSSLSEAQQKAQLQASVVQWEAQIAAIFQATVDRNAALSSERCGRVLERLLPRNLEQMAAELADRPRESFSDGVVRLLAQYKSDLRTALDSYALGGSGAAKDACLEQALLQEVRPSIQNWAVAVLRQYRKHVRSWQEETLQLEAALNAARKQDSVLASGGQKRRSEQQLAAATQELSELRRVLHRELNDTKSELKRLASEVATMGLKHDVRVQSAQSDLQWTRSRTQELEKTLEHERQRKAEASSGAAQQLLAKQRSFHSEERSLLTQQKELLTQVVQLERQLLQKKTQQAQRVFELENQQAQTLDGLKAEQAAFARQLKSQAKTDLGLLRLEHRTQKKALQTESSALDQQMAAIRQRLAGFEAQERAAQASAASSREFFKSLPMMSMPLMQAPAPAAGEEQPLERSTSETAGASPRPAAADMCRQS